MDEPHQSQSVFKPIAEPMPPASASLAAMEKRLLKVERSSRLFRNVLIALASLWLLSGIVNWKGFRYDPYSKLLMHDFCYVDDAFTNLGVAPFGPTRGYVQSLEHQRNPTGPQDMEVETATVEFETIVMVDVDSVAPAMKKLGPYKTDVDARMVHVTFVTGPYSGRVGYLERYKLARMNELSKN